MILDKFLKPCHCATVANSFSFLLHTFTLSHNTYLFFYFSHTVVWVPHGLAWPGPFTTSSYPNLCLTTMSTAFCCVGRILVVDRSRRVPPVPRCPADEDDNYHSFHTQGRTEVSPLAVFYSYYFVTVDGETWILGFIEWGNLFISEIVCFWTAS